MNSINELYDGLSAGLPLDVRTDGTLYKISWLSRLWEWITHSKDQRINRLQRLAEKIFLSYEAKAEEPSIQQFEKIYTWLNRKNDYYLYSVKARRERCRPAPLNEKLKEWAIQWKNEQTVLDIRSLTEGDLNRLTSTSEHPEFIQLLEQSDLRNSFFSWILRYKLPPLLFICFPDLTQKLIKSRLHDQLASDEGAHISIDLSSKKVTILCEGNQKINFLNENEPVTLGNKVFTVKQILADFEESEFRPMELRYFPKLKYPDQTLSLEGVCYWPKAKVQTFIDLTQERFWEAIRPVRRYNPEEASQFFKVPLDGKKWGVGVMATQSFKELRFQGNHALLVIGVPMVDGVYTVFPIGKFPTFYHRNASDLIKLVFEYVDAEYIYPDDNIDMHDREHEILSLAVEEKEGESFFYRVRDDWLKTSLFHLGTKNCCHWAEKHFKNICPDCPPLFETDFFDLTLHPKLKPVFKWLKEHKWAHRLLFKAATFWFGAEKKLERKGKTYNLSQIKPWEKEKGFYSAAQLFTRIERVRELLAQSHPAESIRSPS